MFASILLNYLRFYCLCHRIVNCAPQGCHCWLLQQCPLCRGKGVRAVFCRNCLSRARSTREKSF